MYIKYVKDNLIKSEACIFMMKETYILINKELNNLNLFKNAKHLFFTFLMNVLAHYFSIPMDWPLCGVHCILQGNFMCWKSL